MDIAGITGFAFGDLGKPFIWGHFRIGPEGADEGQFFLAAERNFDAKITTLRPGIVYAETPFSGVNPTTDRRLYGLRAVCSLVCARHETRLRWRTPGTVHAFFVPKGTRRPDEEKKIATIRACAKRGWHVENSDEADAIALWKFAEHEISPALAGETSIGPLWRQEGERA